VSNAFTPNSNSGFTAAYIGNMNWRANLSLRATIASNLIQITYCSALPFKNILRQSRLQKQLGEIEKTWWLSKATEIQNYADANMAHQFHEAIKAVYGSKSHSTHPVRTMMGPI